MRNPKLLTAQFLQQQEPGLDNYQRSEQLRLQHRLSIFKREIQRLIDAYQAGGIELNELKDRRSRLTDECNKIDSQISQAKQLEISKQQKFDLIATINDFCRNITSTLDNPSFEVKQKVLRLLVERIDFVDVQITIKHVIRLSAGSSPADVLLQRRRLHKISDSPPPRRFRIESDELNANARQLNIKCFIG